MKILIVDDSMLMRNVLKEVFRDYGLDVVGEAADGRAAVTLAERLIPDVIVMDFNMPVMNGVEATAEIAKRVGKPVVLFSNEVDARLSFQALQAGAVEVLSKPDFDQFNDAAYTLRLVTTLRAAASRPALPRTGATPVAGFPVSAADPTRHTVQGGVQSHAVEAVVIGASTGGPVAVRTLLAALPANFPVGIALVQHIEDRFDAGYASWLDSSCKLKVRLAQTMDRFVAGEVLVAPGNRHLICHERRLILDDGPKVLNQRPAVDRLFSSAASVYRDRVVGVLLTGMGADGADGCVLIKQAGGVTLVQDEATSFIYGMPRAAAVRGGASRHLPLVVNGGAGLGGGGGPG